MTCPVHGCKVYFGDVEGVSRIGVKGWVKLISTGLVFPQELGEDFGASGNQVAGNTITDLPGSRSRAASTCVPPAFNLSKPTFLLLALLQTKSQSHFHHPHLYPHCKHRVSAYDTT